MVITESIILVLTGSGLFQQVFNGRMPRPQVKIDQSMSALKEKQDQLGKIPKKAIKGRSYRNANSQYKNFRKHEKDMHNGKSTNFLGHHGSDSSKQRKLNQAKFLLKMSKMEKVEFSQRKLNSSSTLLPRFMLRSCSKI